MRGLIILLSELLDPLLDPAVIMIAFLAITGTGRLKPRLRLGIAASAATLATFSTVFLGQDSDVFLAPFHASFLNILAVLIWSLLLLGLHGAWLALRMQRLR
jgi:hypothetical protein